MLAVFELYTKIASAFINDEEIGAVVNAAVEEKESRWGKANIRFERDPSPLQNLPAERLILKLRLKH